MTANPNATELTFLVRRELLQLAKLEDEKASDEAATVPYWSPLPASVQGHRLAAAALRVDADALLVLG